MGVFIQNKNDFDLMKKKSVVETILFTAEELIWKREKTYSYSMITVIFIRSKRKS